MNEQMQAAYADVMQTIAALIKEPWGRVVWRTLMATEPFHYFYYRPKTRAEYVYWTDSVWRTGGSEEDLWLQMAAADTAVRELWKAWIAENPGRSPWTSATLEFSPRGLENAIYGHRHHYQVDPIEEQFAWEYERFGAVYLPLRLRRLLAAAYSAWHRPLRKQRHRLLRRRPRGYWERLPGETPAYRGTRRVRVHALRTENKAAATAKASETIKDA